MMRYLRGMVALGAVSLALLGVSSNARASFVINLYADPGRAPGTLLSTIVDGGQGDSNPNEGEITVSGTDLSNLNSDISPTGVTFTALNGTSNASNPGLTGVLTIGGSITGTGSIYIFNSATDYTAPPGSLYTVDSSFSGTFTALTAGAESYTSYFNPSNGPEATDIPTAPLLFANVGTGSYSDTVAPPLLTAGSTPYSLTNFSALTIASSDPSSLLGFNGTTTVTAVPEPGSVALVLVGGSFLFANKIRRRRAA